MFIITDGKNYVMENPMKKGQYISTTSPIQAKEFTWKQARNLLNNRSKKMSWIKSYHIVNQENGERNENSPNYKGNGGIYIGEKDIDFDDSIIDFIYKETKSIMGLAGWSMEQLKTYEEELNIGLSKYDSAESDIEHALQKYKEDNDGKKPQAHKMAKIGYMLDEIRDKHKHIKQCQRYIKVMQDAITYNYTIEKLKLELTKAKYSDYKGRTEYYQKALDILDQVIKMIIRDNYNIFVQAITQLSKDKHEKFDCCPKCFGETKHRKLQDNELNFGEVLSREIHKRK